MKPRRADRTSGSRQLRVPPGSNRKGIALMGAMVTLAILSLMMMATVRQILATRRMLEHREYELQATWLARAGAERAAAQLLAQPSAYSGELVELTRQSHVHVEVNIITTDSPEMFLITSEARYPTDADDAVVRSVTRRCRRVAEGEKVRLLWCGRPGRL